MNLILSEKAYTEIRQECLRYPQVETGGILVGKCNSDDIVVPLIIGSGLSAQRNPSRFEPDVAWSSPDNDGWQRYQ